MSESSISTSDLPLYVLDGIFYSFGEETTLDNDDVRNYDYVGKLCNVTDHDCGSIFEQYPDASVDQSYSIKQEKEQCSICQCNIVHLILLSDYCTFGKYITSLFIKYIFGP